MLHQNVYVVLVAEDAVAPCTVERGREIGTCLRLVLPLQQDGACQQRLTRFMALRQSKK